MQFPFVIINIEDEKERTDFINQNFILTITRLREKELEYWLDHDEYTILKRKLRDDHISNFGVPISYCSSGTITIRKTDDDYEHDREITIDELKQLIEMNDKVKAYIQKLTDECAIKY